MNIENTVHTARINDAISRCEHTATTMHRMGRELTRARNVGDLDGPLVKMLTPLHAMAVAENRAAETDLLALVRPMEPTDALIREVDGPPVNDPRHIRDDTCRQYADDGEGYDLQ